MLCVCSSRRDWWYTADLISPWPPHQRCQPPPPQRRPHLARTTLRLGCCLGTHRPQLCARRRGGGGGGLRCRPSPRRRRHLSTCRARNVPQAAHGCGPTHTRSDDSLPPREVPPRAQPPSPPPRRPRRSGRVRGVSIFLDKNRRYIGKSQSKRPQQGRNGRRRTTTAPSSAPRHRRRERPSPSSAAAAAASSAS
jgi:hypothetical protein